MTFRPFSSLNYLPQLTKFLTKIRTGENNTIAPLAFFTSLPFKSEIFETAKCNHKYTSEICLNVPTQCFILCYNQYTVRFYWFIALYTSWERQLVIFTILRLLFWMLSSSFAYLVSNLFETYHKTLYDGKKVSFIVFFFHCLGAKCINVGVFEEWK